MEDKIDIHKVNQQFEVALRNFELDENINERNKELIRKFIWDCKIGKTLKGRTKKKIGKRRIMQYIYNFRNLSKWIGKPFDQVTQEEMEKLVSNMEEDAYKNGDEPYCENTKLEYKKALAKFYKWLGRPDLVDFMDMSSTSKDVPAIIRDQAERLINSTYEASLKAAIMVLFDGGPRAEEFLNLRIKDVTRKKNAEENESYWINIRYSKTFGRTIPLPLCSKYLNEWLREHPEQNNPEAQLFPFTYKVLRRKIGRLGEKALKMRITLHMLRHSSATYWAAKMNRYQLCAKYGWAFSSDMPDRYIKRKGIIFEETAEKGDVDQTTRLEKDNRALREKMDDLEREYGKVRKALEFIMPVIMEKMDDTDFQKRILEKRKERLTMNHEDKTSFFKESESVLNS
jgi:integrase